MMNATLRGFLAAFLLMALSVEHRVHALAGDLQRPSLSWPSSTDPAWREAVMKVLTEHPEEFVGGHFINASTTLRYNGPVASLNRFLAGLAGCPGLRIQITFARDQDCAWKVQHHGWADAQQLHIVVRSGDVKFPIEELQLPLITGAHGTPPSGPKDR